MAALDHKEEMLELRHEYLWTLEEIGNEFGVTRERVRQIIGNTGEGFKSRRIKEEINRYPNKSNKEIADLLGIAGSTVSRYRETRSPIRGNSNRARGWKWRLWAERKLSKLGFDAELVPRGQGYDILVNGSIRVTVRFCGSQWDPPSHFGTNPYWTFRNIDAKRATTDFFMLVTKNEDVFIVAKNSIPRNQEEIIFAYPTDRPEIGKYQQYHERYDLLMME